MSRPRPGPRITTACDLDGDGGLDFFVAGAGSPVADGANLVLMATRPAMVGPGASIGTGVGDVNTALWGDIDNDGDDDVYLCRRGPNQLWLQTAPGEWCEATDEAGVSGGDLDTVDGALFDADHDGDLDLFLVQADGDNELLNNNRDGSFRRLAADRGSDRRRPGRRGRWWWRISMAISMPIWWSSIPEPPHQVLENRLLWEYLPATGWEEFVAADVRAAVAGDVDADGSIELYTISEGGVVDRWTSGRTSSWSAQSLTTEPVAVGIPTVSILPMPMAMAFSICWCPAGSGLGRALGGGWSGDGVGQQSLRDRRASSPWIRLVGHRSSVGRRRIGPLAWRAGSGTVRLRGHRVVRSR